MPCTSQQVIDYHCTGTISYPISLPSSFIQKFTVHEFIGHHARLLLEVEHTNLNLKA